MTNDDDLPLSMQPGFDPETPGREYEKRLIDAELRYTDPVGTEEYADRPVHQTGNPLTLGDGTPMAPTRKRT